MYDNEYILELNKYTMERIDMYEYIKRLGQKKEEDRKKKESAKN
jgi:hypothetical protein